MPFKINLCFSIESNTTAQLNATISSLAQTNKNILKNNNKEKNKQPQCALKYNKRRLIV